MGLFKAKPLERYTIRDVKGIARVMVVCRVWVSERTAFMDAVRIEDVTPSCINGEPT